MMRRALIALGLVMSLALVGWQVAGKEHLLANGDVLLLQLAPRDPRSIMQGDYMTLQYAMAREVVPGPGWPRTGTLVVRADAHGVARFVRRDDGRALAADEHRLTYRWRGGQVQIGSNAYHFEEGTAHLYDVARYGEVRVGPDGTTLLVALRDREFRPLGVAARTGPAVAAPSP